MNDFEDNFPTEEPVTRESVLPLSIIDELVARINAAPTTPPPSFEAYAAWVRTEDERFH